MTASNGGIDYTVTSTNRTPSPGVCPGHISSSGGIPAGYETAPLVAGGSTSFDGYKPIEPSSCPTNGGSWIKVPGNSLYNKPNGFCMQQYPTVNIAGVATSQNTGNKWTAINQPDATVAATAIDTGTGSYYASNEWTCYTGPSAENCGVAARNQPIPANSYYTDQFSIFNSYGAFATNASSYYYGDPRYANSALGASVNSSRDKGLGFLRSSYASGSGTIFTFSRGSWTGVKSSGLFTLYIYTTQTYAHASYGFRAAK
ncbi:hypothetical protein H7100_01010 [Candidatus Saccharibacteria bacterium]|nr:hypothetical protein [Candidatus Saccharibacteria bacterium]